MQKQYTMKKSERQVYTWYKFLVSKFDTQKYINIATGETSQAITSFHFFNFLDFSKVYHYLTVITS